MLHVMDVGTINILTMYLCQKSFKATPRSDFFPTVLSSLNVVFTPKVIINQDNIKMIISNNRR